jgi:hypothetical protein
LKCPVLLVQGRIVNIYNAILNVQGHTVNIYNATLNVQDHTANFYNTTLNVQDHTANFYNAMLNVQGQTSNFGRGIKINFCPSANICNANLKVFHGIADIRIKGYHNFKFYASKIIIKKWLKNNMIKLL